MTTIEEHLERTCKVVRLTSEILETIVEEFEKHPGECKQRYDEIYNNVFNEYRILSAAYQEYGHPILKKQLNNVGKTLIDMQDNFSFAIEEGIFDGTIIP
jgi:hypothetical protein